MNKEQRIDKIQTALYDGETLRCPICTVAINFYDNEDKILYRDDALVGKILKCKNGHKCKEIIIEKLK